MINFTDIEDKTIDEAQQKGVNVATLRAPVEEAVVTYVDRVLAVLGDAWKDSL